MSIEKYLNELDNGVANEGLFFNRKPKAYKEIEKVTNNLFNFGKVVESVVNKLAVNEFYPTLNSLKISNKILPKNEIINNCKKIYDEGKHGFILYYPLFTWKHVKSKENIIKSEIRHLHQRLTSIVDLDDPGTVMTYGNISNFTILDLSIESLSTVKQDGDLALVLKTHWGFDTEEKK